MMIGFIFGADEKSDAISKVEMENISYNVTLLNSFSRYAWSANNDELSGANES